MVSPRSAVASDVLSRPRANAREATLVLRDLAAQMPRLHGAEERQARSILARPTDGAADAYGNGYSGKSKRACGNNVCVHWALSGADAPPGAGTAGTPSWVQTTLKTFQNAWQQEIGVLGYRAPKGDLSSRNDGGNRKLDIYLADIGGRGLYGYCTSDDPHIPRYTGADGRRHYDMSAYCVVDDDFATSQFPENTRLENLRVTAAHEFFHAAQFAYDWLEDIWFMEGTATWMEDAVYDGIDDNYQFLRTSALTRPGVPLDLGGKGYEYGSWLFFRHLSETYGARIIRRAWKLAGSAHGDLDRHSTRALAGALSEVGATTQAAFSSFAQANYDPSASYEEGLPYESYLSRAHPPGTTVSLLEPGTGTGLRSVTLDHLSSAYVWVNHPDGVPVHIDVKLPARHGARAFVLRAGPDGATQTLPVSVGSDGLGSVDVPSQAGASKLALLLVNASTRFSCWQGTWFTCQGAPRDDDARFAYSMKLR